ncbi:diacylglycerol kinase [Shewanella maritima]|uniref:diacylglycerol kinase n=1 Tax=Shewanella maritima TaxID=2520507 RepID=UPI003736E6A5
MKPANYGLKRILRASKFSAKGLKAAWVNEAAFRQELLLACVLLPIAWLIEITTVERLLLTMTVFIVLIVELINSAIEAVVDRISDEIHPLSGRAKDIGSAAVMVSLILGGITWASILLPQMLA